MTLQNTRILFWGWLVTLSSSLFGVAHFSSGVTSQTWGRAAVVLFDKEDLEPSSDLLSSRLNDKTFGQKFRLCSNESFLNEPATGRCSGFLAAPDLVVTAGHCLDTLDDPKRLAFVFDYPTDTQTPIPSSKIYYLEKVLARKNDDRGLDFAVIRLNRPVEDRLPAPLALEREVSVGSPLVLAGYPLGLPLKVTEGGKVIGFKDAHYLRTQLQSFKGNSGSPVFNARTGKVEGILVRNEGLSADFTHDEARSCRRLNTCTEQNCAIEEVLSLSSIVPYFPNAATSRSTVTRIEGSNLPIQIEPREKVTVEFPLNSNEVISHVSLLIKIQTSLPTQVKIALESPQGEKALIENVEHWSATEINETFGEEGIVNPGFRTWQGKRALGTWKVTVTNTSSRVAVWESAILQIK